MNENIKMIILKFFEFKIKIRATYNGVIPAATHAADPPELPPLT